MSNSVTYMESRQINIGNFEGIKCSLSFTNEINNTNDKNNIVTINESITILNSKDQMAAGRAVIKRVSKILDEREIAIRSWSDQFTELEFPTLDKLPQTRNF